MPLSNPDFYPVDWSELSLLIKSANLWRCQMCNVECRSEPSAPKGLPSKPVLTVAHIDQDYEADAIFVAALCVRCHLIHDAPFGWISRRRHERWRARQAGQLELRPHNRLSAGELAELASAWPDMPDLPDGIDRFAHLGITGGELP